MSGDIGNGAADLLENKGAAAEARCGRAPGWMRRARGVSTMLALGLMLACSTAYASAAHLPASDTVDDSIVDWCIAIFVIIIGMFIAMIVYDAKKNGRQQ